MKKTFFLFIAVFMIISCGMDKQSSFVVPEDYTSWKKPVNRVLDYEVPGHGKSFRRIYANAIAFKPISKKIRGADTQIMPDGAIIVKETYAKRSDIKKRNYKNLTIMVKDLSSRAANNGWRYFMKAKNKPVMEVKSRMCIGCHEAANEPHPYFDKNKKGLFRDYLFVPFK